MSSSSNAALATGLEVERTRLSAGSGTFASVAPMLGCDSVLASLGELDVARERPPDLPRSWLVSDDFRRDFLGFCVRDVDFGGRKTGCLGMGGGSCCPGPVPQCWKGAAPADFALALREAFGESFVSRWTIGRRQGSGQEESCGPCGKEPGSIRFKLWGLTLCFDGEPVLLSYFRRLS